MPSGATRPCAPRRHDALVGVGSLVLAVLLTGCTTSGADVPPPASPARATASDGPSVSATTGTPATTPGTTPGTTPAVGSTSPSATRGTESTVPPTVGGSVPYFSPTDPTGFTLTGRVVVSAARQDPFSNLLQRGALHERPVTLDVVSTPDAPVTPAPGVTVLLATCRCPTRGEGLRLTLPDADALHVLPGGDIAITGTFRATVTAADAITLSRAG